jgi:hypothetical protein
VEIHAEILNSWIKFASQDTDGALASLRSAVERESNMLIPDGVILPAAEILGDMYLAANRYDEAIAAYESSRQKRRRGAVSGALQAAVALKDASRIARYQALLADISNGAAQWQASAR